MEEMKNERVFKRHIWKFKPEEVEMIHDRMKEAGVQNMSAFIRKMVLNGYMIIPEWPELKGGAVFAFKN